MKPSALCPTLIPQIGTSIFFFYKIVVLRLLRQQHTEGTSGTWMRHQSPACSHRNKPSQRRVLGETKRVLPPAPRRWLLHKRTNLHPCDVSREITAPREPTPACNGSSRSRWDRAQTTKGTRRGEERMIGRAAAVGAGFTRNRASVHGNHR